MGLNRMVRMACCVRSPSSKSDIMECDGELGIARDALITRRPGVRIPPPLPANPGYCCRQEGPHTRAFAVSGPSPPGRSSGFAQLGLRAEPAPQGSAIGQHLTRSCPPAEGLRYRMNSSGHGAPAAAPPGGSPPPGREPRRAKARRPQSGWHSRNSSTAAEVSSRNSTQ